jgi:hypothetical protein
MPPEPPEPAPATPAPAAEAEPEDPEEPEDEPMDEETRARFDRLERQIDLFRAVGTPPPQPITLSVEPGAIVINNGGQAERALTQSDKMLVDMVEFARTAIERVAPVIHVAAPNVTVEAPTVNVAAPTVNVEPAQLNLEAVIESPEVHIAHPERAVVTHERDKAGELLRSVTTYEVTDAREAPPSRPVQKQAKRKQER